MQCFSLTCNIASASAFYPSRPQKNPQNYPHFNIRKSAGPQIRILPEASTGRFQMTRILRLHDTTAWMMYTRHNLLSNWLFNRFDNRRTTGCIVYTNIQPRCQTGWTARVTKGVELDECDILDNVMKWIKTMMWLRLRVLRKLRW